MGGAVSSTTAEVFTQIYEQFATSATLHPQKFRKDLFRMFTPFLKVCTWKTFLITSTIFIKTLTLLLEEESNGEPAFLDTLFKSNNGKISVLV